MYRKIKLKNKVKYNVTFVEKKSFTRVIHTQLNQNDTIKLRYYLKRQRHDLRPNL